MIRKRIPSTLLLLMCFSVTQNSGRSLLPLEVARILGPLNGVTTSSHTVMAKSSHGYDQVSSELLQLSGKHYKVSCVDFADHKYGILIETPLGEICCFPDVAGTIVEATFFSS